jgi:chromosomal replication initiation ATPase DnaA
MTEISPERRTQAYLHYFIDRYTQKSRSLYTVGEIEAAVCYEFGIPIEDIVQKINKRMLVEARYVRFLLLREYITGISLQEIGKIRTTTKVSYWNHATVYYGINMIKQLAQTDTRIRNLITSCKLSIESRKFVTFAENE